MTMQPKHCNLCHSGKFGRGYVDGCCCCDVHMAHGGSFTDKQEAELCLRSPTGRLGRNEPEMQDLPRPHKFPDTL